MGTPVATPDDLQTYLGLQAVDTARATMLLEDAQNLCESIVSPLPATARGIVVSIAARAYTNAGQYQDASLGTARVQFAASGAGTPVGGMYLSRSDKANLRRLAGSGGAFSVDPLPKGTSAVQLVTLTNVTGGTFVLSFVNQPTSPIPYNADAVTVQAAINALTAIGAGNVLVTGNPAGPWTVTFAGVLATTPVPTLGVDSSGLTGTSPSAAVTVVTKGVLAAGQGLPPWDFDYYDFGSTQYVPGGFT